MQTNRWIWLDTSRMENVFARSRKTFHVDVRPGCASLELTCFGHYKLWINGRYVGRGPASSGTNPKLYDSHDISTYLREGNNTVAVQIIHYGYRLSSFPAAAGALWCRIVWEGGEAETDNSWKISIDPCYDPDSVRRNHFYGVMEIYDARKQQDWQMPEYDDAGWPFAIDVLGLESTVLQSRAIPYELEASILPKQIVKTGETLYQEFGPHIHGGIIGNIATYQLLDVPEPPRVTLIEHPERMLTDDDSYAFVYQPSPEDHRGLNSIARLLSLTSAKK